MEILVTKRLTLRPPLEVDADAITAAFQNTNITRNLSAAPNPYKRADALDWIENKASDPDAVNLSIHRQRLLGVVSVRKNSQGHYDLGYWLDEPAWGCGFMTEAARAALSHAFRKFGLSDVHSGAYEDNPASMAVLNKLGFEKGPEDERHFNPTRNCDVLCNRVILTRDHFISLFGDPETRQAA